MITLFIIVPLFSIILIFLIGIVLYSYDQEISRINFKILNLSERIRQENINLILNHIQMGKIASTNGSQIILANLKSKDSEFLGGVLKEEIINMYTAMTKGKIDRERLRKMDIKELENLSDKIDKSFYDSANALVKEKKQKEKELNIKIKKRNIIYYIIVFMQSIITIISLLITL